MTGTNLSLKPTVKNATRKLVELLSSNVKGRSGKLVQVVPKVERENRNAQRLLGSQQAERLLSLSVKTTSVCCEQMC